MAGERMAWIGLCPDCAAGRAALVDDPDSRTRRQDALRFQRQNTREGLRTERRTVEAVRSLLGDHVAGCPFAEAP